MMPREEFEVAVNRIPYAYAHPQILAGIIRWMRPEIVVEVGTHIGYAACWMARALQENDAAYFVPRSRLFCIDNFCWREHNQEEQWNANIDRCGVRDFVTLIKGRSQDCLWPERVDMAYIDGNHCYSVCEHDVLKARDLGASVIVIHDTVSCLGPRCYTNSFRTAGDDWYQHWDILEDNRDSGLMILKKREPKPAVDPYDVSDQWDTAAVRATVASPEFQQSLREGTEKARKFMQDWRRDATPTWDQLNRPVTI